MDAVEAMASNRAYRKANNTQMRFKNSRGCAGTRFDPELVEVLAEQVLD